MKENKLTPEEIKKALECCKPDNEEGCLNCPLVNVPLPECVEVLFEEALDLINRQQTAINVYMQENDRLKTAYIQVSEDRNEIRKETEAEIERLQTENNQFADIGKMYSEIRTEAIKEFAERLKAKKHECGCNFRKKPVFAVTEEKIDEAYKEMAGEGKC